VSFYRVPGTVPPLRRRKKCVPCISSQQGRAAATYHRKEQQRGTRCTTSTGMLCSSRWPTSCSAHDPQPRQKVPRWGSAANKTQRRPSAWTCKARHLLQPDGAASKTNGEWLICWRCTPNWASIALSDPTMTSWPPAARTTSRRRERRRRWRWRRRRRRRRRRRYRWPTSMARARRDVPKTSKRRPRRAGCERVHHSACTTAGTC